jgi:hypothetical protein
VAERVSPKTGFRPEEKKKKKIDPRSEKKKRVSLV